MNIKDLGSNICLSGGAEGADILWGKCAKATGFQVIHWSFSGHKSNAEKQDIFYLNDQQLEEADAACLQASKNLKRYFPPKNKFIQNLLRRNYYQVAWSDSVYAISTIQNGMVMGGTGWAVQMFLDRHDNAPCNAYVFCQNECRWYKWDGLWNTIYEPPTPSGIWAGVGSRDLKTTGKLAIEVLLNYNGIRKFDRTTRGTQVLSLHA